MSRLKCLSVAVIIAMAAAASALDCPDASWLQEGDSCFKLIQEEFGRTQSQAKTHCRELHDFGGLLWLDSNEEKRWVRYFKWDLKRQRDKCKDCDRLLDAAWVGLFREPQPPYAFFWDPGNGPTVKDTLLTSSDWFWHSGHPKPPSDGMFMAALTEATNTSGHLYRTNFGNEKMWHICKIKDPVTTTVRPTTSQSRPTELTTTEPTTTESTTIEPTTTKPTTIEPTTTQTTTTEPTTTEPTTTEPTSTQPTTTESTTTEPTTTEPTSTQPTTTEPTTTKPTATEPTTTKPTTTEPTTTKPTTTEPTTTKPTTTEPTITKPTTTEPTTTKLTTTEPTTTKLTTTEPTTTKPTTTEPTTTKPATTTEPTSTEPTSTEPTSTEPTSTEPTRTEPNTTEPNTTESNITESNITEPNSTEPTTTEPTTIEMTDNPQSSRRSRGISTDHISFSTAKTLATTEESSGVDDNWFASLMSVWLIAGAVIATTTLFVISVVAIHLRTSRVANFAGSTWTARVAPAPSATKPAQSQLGVPTKVQDVEEVVLVT